jgi:glutathione S-transferase
MINLPILYSFRRCPYAMRARMAIIASGLQVELREIVLRDKPLEMLAASPKATVPVLVLPDGIVIDESRDIMLWALSLSDPEGLLSEIDNALITENDGPFKAALDRYKYPHRYDLADGFAHRNDAMNFVSKLNHMLNQRPYLSGEILGFTDIAIAPFIRQFVATDKEWFNTQGLVAVSDWLETITTSTLFETVMVRYPAWQTGDAATVFPAAT